MKRVRKKTYTGLPAGTPADPVTYAYDACGNGKGRLCSATAGDTTTEYTYDAAGRVATSQQRTASVDYPFSYAYNLSGALTQITYPSGRTAATGYDVAGRATGVSSGSYNAAVSEYHPHGAIKTLGLGNGVVETALYNSRHQMMSLTAVKGTPLLSLGYGYPAGNNGNVASQTIGDQTGNWTQSYQYDNLNRLTQAAEGTWTQNYGYDRWGNRWVSATFPLHLGTPTAAGQYNAGTNRIQLTSANQAMPADAYDVQGNLTNHPWVGVMSYDGEGRIWKHVSGGTTVEFTYDGEGRRVKKKVGVGAPTVYVCDAAGQLGAEYGTSDGAMACTKCYLTADHLGSTRLTTDETGAVKGRLDYFPFGEVIPDGATFGGRVVAGGPRQRFTGKERDAETGLDYFGARYFSGAQGRFTGPDAPMADQHPADPQSWNLYSYVRNNPVRYVDPTGRDCIGAVLGNHSGESCVDQLIGGAKAVGNIPSGFATLANRTINTLTGSNLPDAPQFEATNRDQQEGMDAANLMMLVSPLAELGAARAATAATEVPLITQNAARCAASEARILNDMGLTKNTRPIAGTAGKSIPDINTSTVVGDIKDVTTVSNTKQIQIQREVAGQTGRDHVVTGTNTHVTAPAQRPPTKVIRRGDLGPKQ